MRIRKKPWADEEFNTNKRWISIPEENKGNWKKLFGNFNPIHIEIGCGKGRFITNMSNINKNVNYIAVERQKMVLASALKKSRENETGDNLKFIMADVKNLSDFFNPGEIDRIYINFCDPWPNKNKWAKRRLTHKNFLNLYAELFEYTGEIFLKTDNRILFEFSLNEFEAHPLYKMRNICLDLHNSSFEQSNVMTEYEAKFTQKKMPIFRLEAVYNKEGVFYN